jgi:hypothetical protein
VQRSARGRFRKTVSTPLTDEQEPADRTQQLAPAERPPHGPAVVVAAALEGMRPYQWLKNTLVFVPFIAARRPGEAGHLIIATATFIAFNFCASAI